MNGEQALNELREAMLEPDYVLDSVAFDIHAAHGGQGEPSVVLEHVTGAALLLEFERLRRIEEAARAIWQEPDGLWQHHCSDGVGGCMAVSASRAHDMDVALKSDSPTEGTGGE